MNKVKFISTTYLKENTSIENNVDDDKLVPYIYKVQDIYLQQSLGTTFYDDLKDKIANNNLNSDETDLIRKYIQPMVAEYVVYEALPHLNFKMTNKAISQENSEFSQPSALDVIKYLRDNVRNMAEFYNKRLVKFLCDKSELFEKYRNPDADENLEKTSRVYRGGIFIPSRKPRNIRTYNDPSDDCCCD